MREVLKGLDYLHTKCKIIHTDLKPENICICVSEDYIHRFDQNGIVMYSIQLIYFRIALEAYEWHQSGAAPSAGHVASYIAKPKTNLTRSQKKAAKDKEKKREE